jgi:hypothetical protein
MLDFRPCPADEEPAAALVQGMRDMYAVAGRSPDPLAQPRPQLRVRTPRTPVRREVREHAALDGHALDALGDQRDRRRAVEEDVVVVAGRTGRGRVPAAA